MKKPIVRTRTRFILPVAAMAGLFSAFTLASGCVGSDVDFHAELLEECDYRRAETKIGSDPIRTSLTPGCKEALLAYLPFDETWEGAPAGLQDKVIESFQVVLAYPLTLPPENRVLGQAPWSMHARQICTLAPQLFDACKGPRKDASEVNLARNAFNYLMSRIQRITYIPPSENPSQTASLTPDVSLHGPGYLLSITNNFWSRNSDFSRSPFVRASVLMHEAWHGDSRTHTLCPSEADVNGFNCDADTSGPYMFETVYLLSLVHGSALLEKEAAQPSGDGEGGGLLDDLLPIGGGNGGTPPPREYLLSGTDITLIAGDVCQNLKFRVKTMRHLVEDTPSCWSVNAEWLLSREGIAR